MKILVFHQFYTSLEEAGISRFNLFAEEWAKQGVETVVISGSINYMTGKKEKSCSSDNVKIIRVLSSSWGYRTFLGRMLSYVTFTCSAFFVGLFVSRPDVVIASSPPVFIGFAASAVSFFRRIPFVFEVRDPWPDVAVALGFVKNRTIIALTNLAAKLLYASARLLVVNSPGLQEFLLKIKGVRGKKIGVIPNPLIFSSPKLKETRESARKKMHWNNKFVIIYSGAMSAVYDFDLLLDVAKRFLDKPEVLFVLVGDGRQKQYIVERIKKERIHNILLLPSVSRKKVARLIGAADVGIAILKDIKPLKYVYATKIFDYMIAKKPIILAMMGVSAELVCDRAQAGICLTPGDIEGIENAVHELLDDPEWRHTLGKQGYVFARENLLVNKLAADYLELLKPIVIPQRKSN